MNQTQTKLESLETRKFLELLFFRYYMEPKGYIEIRIVSEDRASCFSKFYSLDHSGEKSLEEILELNATHHIYFGVNPRPISKAKKQEDINSVVCLWADLDTRILPGVRIQLSSVLKHSPYHVPR